MACAEIGSQTRSFSLVSCFWKFQIRLFDSPPIMEGTGYELFLSILVCVSLCPSLSLSLSLSKPDLSFRSYSSSSSAQVLLLLLPRGSGSSDLCTTESNSDWSSAEKESHAEGNDRDRVRRGRATLHRQHQLLPQPPSSLFQLICAAVFFLSPL
mmetsp:Transcript_35756/g.77296  ORF Transcript_35756/g.77296 Transcript_35756/m.77296 type:complete len:154 (+) Transcript_35756:133-594(+)